VIRNCWDPFCRIEIKDLIQLGRPVITNSRWHERPASGVSQSLTLGEIVGASPQLIGHLFLYPCKLPQLPLVLPEFSFGLLSILNVGSRGIPADDFSAFV